MSYLKQVAVCIAGALALAPLGARAADVEKKPLPGTAEPAAPPANKPPPQSQAQGGGESHGSGSSKKESSKKEENKKDDDWSRVGVGLSAGVNGLGPTVYLRPTPKDSIAVSLVPIVAPEFIVLNGGLKYDRVIAKKKQTELYLDASFGFYLWDDVLHMVAPAAGAGIHYREPYWDLAEVWFQVDLTGLILLDIPETDVDESRALLLPLPAAGVSWNF